MLTKTQILTAIQKSLIKYNELAVSQMNSKISAHNQPVSQSANGHMSKGDKSKLDSIIAEVDATDDEIAAMIANVQSAING